MTAMDNSTTGLVAFRFFVHAVLWLPAGLEGGTYLIMNPIKEFKKINFD